MLEISIHHLQYRYPNQSQNLFTDISFSINAQGKIGLLGNNGCGKSTLFALLRGKILPNAGQIIGTMPQIAYLPQEISLQTEQSVADYLWQSRPELANLQRQIIELEAGPAMADTSVYDDFLIAGGYEFAAKIAKNWLKFGFTQAELSRSIKELSGGEQTKVALCALLLTEPALLLLDEPSNHLDGPSLIWLEHYLLNLTIPYGKPPLK